MTCLAAISTDDTVPQSTKEPVKRSKKPISTVAFLVATSAAMRAASQGVIVKIPIASSTTTITGTINYRIGSLVKTYNFNV